MAFDVDCLRVRPTVERPVADRRYACGNGYAGKASGIVERTGTDIGKLAFRRKRYAGNGGIRAGRCPSECVAGISTMVNFRYEQVCTACVGAVVGGYMYRSGCRSSADAAGGTIAEKRKAESCRAGGVVVITSALS
jgi:hypothetical protein